MDHFEANIEQFNASKTRQSFPNTYSAVRPRPGWNRSALCTLLILTSTNPPHLPPLPFPISGNPPTCNNSYPDTKHNLVSFSITALKEVEVTAALELLHGMYYSDFDSMLQNVGELFIFTPGRSDYKPLEPSRKSFFFVLDKSDFDDLQV